MNKLAIAILLICSHLSYGQENNFSGRVPYGSEIYNGKTALTFKIPEIGWEETHDAVEISDAYFLITLGGINTLDKVALKEKATIYRSFYHEGPGVLVDIYHNGKLFSQDIFYLDGTVKPKPPLPEIIEVPDEEEIEEEIEIDLDAMLTGDYEMEEITYKDPVEEEVFVIVETSAQYPGGMAAFYDILASNMIYPNEAKKMGIEGRVFVEFIINRDGSLSDIKVVKGLGYGCDKEAVRLINNSPKWVPGEQRGRTVRHKNVMPVLFKMN